MQTTRAGQGQSAIVIGGSIAGLLAARVLSEHYEEVTIVERDIFPSGAEQRRGVPQGRHTHGLLTGGCTALEKLFPGIAGALIEGGAISGDIGRDCRWFLEGGYLSRPAGGLNGLFVSRPMLEAAVRERTLALPNIRKRENAVVASLVINELAGRVAGIQVEGEVLTADLVVDATGRGSRTPQWLRNMGYPPPREETVQVNLGYATRLFRRRPSDLGGDLAAVAPCTPEGKRSGIMLAQEGDRWTVTLNSYFGNYPPAELDGFIQFARTLAAPDIYEVVRRAEPLGDAASLRYPASVRRRYEELSRFPAGLLVVGDAICTFNPRFGQGMSVAALEALELQKILDANPRDLARRFFARAAKVVDTPWSIAVGSDLRVPETVGRRTAFGKFMNWYISKLHRAGHTDPAAALAFLKVSNLVAPPPSILHPRVALRVLWQNFKAASPRNEQIPVRSV